MYRNKRRFKSNKLLLLFLVFIIGLMSTVSPTQDKAAAMSPKQLVQKGEVLGNSLKYNISYKHRLKANPKTMFNYPDMNLIDKTERALKDAQKAISKLKGKEKKTLENRLNKNVKNPYEQAMIYVNAVTAGKAVTEKTKLVKERLDKGKVDSTTVRQKKELEDSLKKNIPAIKKVSEKIMREGLTSYYVKTADNMVDLANLSISIKNSEDLLSKSLKAKDADKSIEYSNKLSRLFSDGKKSGMLKEKSILYTILYKSYKQLKNNYDSFVLLSTSTSSTKPNIIGGQLDKVKTFNSSIVIVAGKNHYIKLANAKVNGDIVIKGDKTGAGTVYLDNVKVIKVKGTGGTVIVQDVADHSLHLSNVMADELKVTDLNGANIIASKGTRIPTVNVVESAGVSGLLSLESQEKGVFGTVELSAKGTATSKGTNLKGDFSESNISITGENSRVNVDANAKVKVININTSASLSASVGAKIQSVNLAALKKEQSILLNGDLSNAIVNIMNANANITVGQNANIKEVKKDSQVSDIVTIVNYGRIEEVQGVEITHNPPISQPVVDGTPPVVNGVKDGEKYHTEVKPTFNEGYGILTRDGETPKPIHSGDSVSEDGEYVLTVTDASGNKTTVHFTIDKTPPTVSGVTNNQLINKEITITFDEGNATLSKDGKTPDLFTSGTVISNEGYYELIITDDAGNVTTIHFIIDKTAPVVSGVEDGETSTNPVTPLFTESIATLSKDGGTAISFTAGTPIIGAGKYELIVTDQAGNQTIIHFTIENTNYASFTSKAITNFDYSTIYATQARQESVQISSTDFSKHPVSFTISDRTITIPVKLDWDIPLNGFTTGQVVGSAVDSFIQQYCNDHGINLGNRTMGAVGFGDTFFIFTFQTGASASITLGGNDWSAFFKNSNYLGKDEDRSKNREFMLSDGTNISTILLEWEYRDMDDLVDDLNYQISNTSVPAKVLKVDEDHFKIVATDSSIKLTISGKDKDEFFTDF